MSNTIDFPINCLFRRDIFGKPEILAEVTFSFYCGDKTGELKQYAIHDPHFDEWVCVDLKKLNPFQLDDIQKKIDKHILENPELNEREPEEAS